MRFTAFLSHLPFFLTVYRFFQHFIHFFICICISLFALDNSWYVLRVGVYFFHHNHHKLLIHIHFHIHLHYHSHSHIHVVMVYDFSKRVRTLRCIFFVFRHEKRHCTNCAMPCVCLVKTQYMRFYDVISFRTADQSSTVICRYMGVPVLRLSGCHRNRALPTHTLWSR